MLEFPLSADPNLIAFPCQHCGKRLKAPPKMSGRHVKCPKCSESVRVPDSGPAAGKPVAAGANNQVLDPLSLSEPAIADLGQRDDSAKQIRTKKNQNREISRRRAQGKEPVGNVQPMKGTANLTASGTVPFDDDDAAELQGNESESGAQAGPSVFDDDLPDLDSLAVAPEKHVEHSSKPANSTAGKSGKSETTAASFEEEEFDFALESLEEPSSTATGRAAQVSASMAHRVDADDDLDDLLPELSPVPPGKMTLPPLIEEEALEDSEYRIICNTCGTAQYVSPSVKGMKVKCPDCFSQFKAPPPPKDWKPKPRTHSKASSDMELVPSTNAAAEERDNLNRKAKAEQMLNKAEGEIEKEESENRYELDFDNVGFARRTFGFLGDPLVLAQIFGYGVVFGLLFGLYQYALNQGDTQYGKGLMLAVGILVPICSILFALPMLSGGLALIEGVANKQRYVREIPAFNIFDNFADLLVIAFAFGAAVVPGFLVGSLIAMYTEGAMYMRLIGMFGTTFVLFPIFLLSMMDNSSLFAPISGAVMSSLAKAAESWGSYYMKTMIGMLFVLIAWFVLLGGNVVLAAMAGFLFPLLLFFICQQIGGLADAISDHLSFEFVPTEREDHSHDQYTID